MSVSQEAKIASAKAVIPAKAGIRSISVFASHRFQARRSNLRNRLAPRLKRGAYLIYMPNITENKDAHHKYNIFETLEAGIVLTGHEAKSARRGTVSLKGSYVVLKGEEPYLVNAHIGSFQPSNAPEGYDPLRSRKILMHSEEIKKIIGKNKGQALTMVPLRLYSSRGVMKVEIGLARAKSNKDKRDTIKKREANREIARAMRSKE